MMNWHCELNEQNIKDMEDPAVNLLWNLLSGMEPANITDEEVEMMVAKFGEDIRTTLRPTV